jgi:uncharacterized protein YjbI with pentapeptide repeats
LVQEYKNAPSLAEPRSFTPKDIKQIAVSVLEILVYLQQRTPPVIHRDIKPENILVDEQLNAYLVDFGFARIRGGELALSSVAAGTPGFMPPEEQFGRPLTQASDLYSLGATLICLLTGTRSVDVGNLIDDDYRFDFKKLVPQLSPGFISWLEKMVAPNVKQRYANAAAALEALQPIRVVGGATRVESLVGVIKRSKLIAVLGLATLVIAGVGTTWMSFRQDSPVRQLLKTKQCQGCNLKRADLGGADLMNAGLKYADLMNAVLSYANLTYADLRDADLSYANLTYANLSYADLKDAALWNANLWSANLGGAKLGSAKLGSAKLGSANLRSADLTSADLTSADLRSADLRSAKLMSADLSSADLRSAKLRSADLWGADLWGADLGGADLRGADLRSAKLKGTNLKGAIMPDGTIHK